MSYKITEKEKLILQKKYEKYKDSPFLLGAYISLLTHNLFFGTLFEMTDTRKTRKLKRFIERREAFRDYLVGLCENQK